MSLPNPKKYNLSMLAAALAAAIIPFGNLAQVTHAAWGVLSDMHSYHECFGLDADTCNYPNSGTSPKWKLQGQYKVVLLESNAAGNVFHEQEQPRFMFQIENLTDKPLKVHGRIEVIRYSQSGVPGDQWYPELRRLEVVGSAPLSVDLAPEAWASMPQIARDNVLIAFNAIPMDEDGWQTHLPGRMPKFVWYKTTDYEFALNKVDDNYGGGTEIWR